MNDSTLKNTFNEKPSEVTSAVKLIYISMVIGFIRSIFIFPEMTTQISASFILIIVIVTYALIFIITDNISKRKNWARIIFLIMMILGTPCSIPITIQEMAENYALGSVSVFTIAFQIIATVKLFQKPSNDWFRGGKSTKDLNLEQPT